MKAIKLNQDATYYVRFSDHIDEDLKRGWSSWNFGEEGLSATEEQIDAWKEEATENDQPFCISGFELWGDDIANADIRELYPGYWVVVDNFNAQGGLSGHQLPEGLETLEDVLNEIKSKKGKYDGTGEGETIYTETAKVLYSEDNMHIIEVL